MTRTRVILRSWFLPTMTLVVSGVFISLGWWLYRSAGGATAGFTVKLAGLCLQLAMIVIIGGSFKLVWDWLEKERIREVEEERTRHEQKAEFARRMRDIHVQIVLVRDLLRAEKSPAAYVDQLRHLMSLRFVAEDIQADLEATEGLFAKHEVILSGIGGIVSFLKGGADEYQWAHDLVKGSLDLKEIAVEADMEWLRGFMAEGEKWERYGDLIAASKGEMREQVYGL